MFISIFFVQEKQLWHMIFPVILQSGATCAPHNLDKQDYAAINNVYLLKYSNIRWEEELAPK